MGRWSYLKRKELGVKICRVSWSSDLEHGIQVLVVSLSYRGVGSNPGHDTFVREQDALL